VIGLQNYLAKNFEGNLLMGKIKTYAVEKTAKSLKLQKLIYTLAIIVGFVFYLC